jgi:hypothetical protein
MAVEEICRRLEVMQATFYRWTRKFSGMRLSELCRLKQLSGKEPLGNDSTTAKRKQSTNTTWASSCPRIWHTTALQRETGYP